jgi:hypothetical protein
MARIGLLYLREGYWEGQQILPPGFVDEVRSPVPGVVGLPVGSNTPWGAEGAADHYGLLWWNNADGSLPGVPSDAFWSYGLFESFIIVIPSLDIVVSRAGSAWFGTRAPSYYLILEPFLQPIVEAVVEEQPVPVPSMSKWGVVFSSALVLLVGAGLMGGLQQPASARKGPRSGDHAKQLESQVVEWHAGRDSSGFRRHRKSRTSRT